ncbi:hypothetical protein AB5I41_10415 [Sphingomonas sp. MMS24-JH45]
MGHAGQLFEVEAGGGVVLGLVIGWIAFRMMRSIDDYKVEVLISLAVVMGTCDRATAPCQRPRDDGSSGTHHRQHGVAHAMSETTRDYLHRLPGPDRRYPQYRAVPADRAGVVTISRRPQAGGAGHSGHPAGARCAQRCRCCCRSGRSGRRTAMA